jgi:hypothetical protein
MVCLATTATPDVAILGDSHAVVLMTAPMLGKTSANIAMFGNYGCLPFLAYTSHFPFETSQQKNCSGAIQHALDVIRHQSNIKTVVLVNRGPLYLSGHGFGIDEGQSMLMYDNNDKEVNAKVAYLDGYNDIIKQLLLAGKRVVFLVTWPELGVDPVGCVGSRLLSVSKKVEAVDCRVPVAVVRERQAEYRAMIEKIKQQNPAVEVYDPHNLFCDHQFCYGIRNGHLYYEDDDHISAYGSMTVINDLQKWLQKTKKPE